MDQTSWDAILAVLPNPLRQYLRQSSIDGQSVTELRIRLGQNVQICTVHDRFFLDEQYNFCADEAFCAQVLDFAAQHSLFRVQHQMAQGFIALEGGVRVGISGGFVHGTDAITGILPVTGFCFRAPHQILGVSDALMKQLFSNGACESTLVISPPGMGKTTLLRDMARYASCYGKNVTVIDERGELSGWRQGKIAFDLGPCTDVFYDIPVSRGMMLCLRTLAPEVIVCDEIGNQSDADALQEAARCGTVVFASAHARDVDDLLHRPMLANCMRSCSFSNIVVLGPKGRIRQIVSGKAADGCMCSG